MPWSHVNGFAVNFDGTDTGSIAGSGAAVKFGGQEICLRASGGKWYNWDRLIWDGSSLTFNNNDNTPVFLGTLAKASGIIYVHNNLMSGFREAEFFDGSGTRTHRFLPYLNDSNQKGFWDTVTGTFKTVNDQSYWSAITSYTYRSIRVHSSMSKIGGTGNYQSACEIKGWQIAVQDGQRYFVLTNDKYMLHSGESAANQSGRVLEASTYNSNWHGNTCWFGSEYADTSDFFPLLYVGTDKGNHLLTVYRLEGSDPTTCTISLVQRIYTPIGDTTYGETLYYHNYYGKAGCDTFLQAAYTKNSYSSSSDGNVYMYRVFPLPALSAGSEVTLTESDMLARGDVGFVSTGQNGGWNGKYFILGSVQYLTAYEITSNGATSIKRIDHQTSSSADIVTTEESEGFCWCDEKGYFVAMWNSTYGTTFDAYMDDYKPYAIDVYNDWY